VENRHNRSAKHNGTPKVWDASSIQRKITGPQASHQ
jgi:hypothetical protein